MAEGDAQRSKSKREPRFVVGWQKLTKNEFLEALTLAVLDKVRFRRLQHAEEHTSKPNQEPEF